MRTVGALGSLSVVVVVVVSSAKVDWSCFSHSPSSWSSWRDIRGGSGSSFWAAVVVVVLPKGEALDGWGVEALGKSRL